MEVEREITDLQATISELHANIRELRTEVAELKKWIGAVASRPDPNRVIGPRHGQPPSPGWKTRDQIHWQMPPHNKWLRNLPEPEPVEYADPLDSNDDVIR